jgi:protein O-mannosyl-transferase
VAFAPALNLGFTNFDDTQYVLANRHVLSGMTWQSAAWALTAGHAGNWHPLTWLSHMADVELYGLSPRGHHATSVVIHLLNTLLLFAVLARATGEGVRSAVVAALFGVHPLHVESVAWISERKDVLSTLFAMLTLWAYVRFAETRSRPWYGLVILCFVLGLATKPMLVTLPFVLLLLDFWPLRRMTLPDRAPARGILHVTRMTGFRSLIVEKIPLFVCVLASSAITYAVQQNAGAVRPLDVLPLNLRLTNAVMAYVAYIGQMFWPVDLAPLYPYSTDGSYWRALLALALLTGLTVLAVRAVSRRPSFTVGWFWYVGTLVPVIGLVQVGSQPMADRYTYLPLVGLFIALVWGLPDVLQRWPGRQYLLSAAAATVIVVSVVLTRQQVAIWTNSVDLWEHTLRVTRNNYRAHNNLGHALAEAGRPDAALSHYLTALEINPDSVEGHVGAGDVLASTGRLEEAISHYRDALRRTPGDVPARTNLGAALAQQGQFTEAERHLRAALEMQPDLPTAHTNLGIALATQGRLADAIAHLARAVELQPADTVAHRHLGAALAIAGRTDDAIVQLETAVRLEPADARARNALGDALAAAGRLDAAVAEYEKAVQLSPSLGEARANLGNSLAKLGRVEDAIVHLREAIRIRPADSDARYDLAVVLWRNGQAAEARQQLETVVRQNPGHEPARHMLMDLRRRAAGTQ